MELKEKKLKEALLEEEEKKKKKDTGREEDIGKKWGGKGWGKAKIVQSENGEGM